MNVKRTQAERSEATRAALIDAARPLFAERGYAGVGAEEIVRAAGLTRGALYHHFGGKRDLFEAVYEGLEAELAQRIAEGALGGGATDPLAAMRAGAEMFLQACTEPDVQRIVLLDGPSVLGWDRWREIAAEHGLGLIEATLQAARSAFHDRRIIAAFQPHLYTRTRDFHVEFAKALSHADVVFLANLYPAREQPIEGVSSEMIATPMRNAGRAPLWEGPRTELAAALENVVRDGDVVITIGAGDITRTGPELKTLLESNS